MSGTSVDGVDAVLADFSSGRPKVLAHVYRPFDADLRAELLQLCTSGADEIELPAPARVKARGRLCRMRAIDARRRQPYGLRRPCNRRAWSDGAAPSRCRLHGSAERAGASGGSHRHRCRSPISAAATLPRAARVPRWSPAFHAAVFARGCAARSRQHRRHQQHHVSAGRDPADARVRLRARQRAARPERGTPSRHSRWTGTASWREQGRADEALAVAAARRTPFSRSPRRRAPDASSFRPPGSTPRPTNSVRASRRAAHVDRADRPNHWRCDRPLVRHGRDVVACGGGTRNPVLMRALAAAIAPRALRDFRRASESRPIRSKRSRLPGSLGALSGASPALCRKSPVRAGRRVLGALYPA